MLEQILALDLKIFFYFNHMGSPQFDTIVDFISNSLFFSWGLFFFIPFLLCLKIYKKHMISIFFFAALAIGASDYVSSSIFKPAFERLRPCKEEALKGQVYLPFGETTCSGTYGFVSSHAANSFAISMFFFLLLSKLSKHIGWMFVFSALVSWTRIYLGKHYPPSI